jgi:thiol-disulfide isomerase/thioredoxin
MYLAGHAGTRGSRAARLSCSLRANVPLRGRRTLVPVTTGVWVLVAALVLASLVGVAKRWYDGRFHMVGLGRRSVPVHDSEYTAATADNAVRLAATDLGADLGERATLVQFSSAFCQPCRATRRVLADVADVVPGVAHVEIDAESRLDLVRRLDVMRTPTTLVLDADGRVTNRASGQPRKEQVLAALPF